MKNDKDTDKNTIREKSQVGEGNTTEKLYRWDGY
jgi:hypothetical protein